MKKRLSVILSVCLSFALVLTSLSVSASEAKDSEEQVEQSSALTLEELPNEMLENIQLQLAEKGVEVTALDEADCDDLNTITTINADGSKTLCIYGYPVKYVDEESGAIKFVDNSLKKIGFWKGLVDGIAFENAENSIKTYFPKKISKGVQMVTENYALSVYPEIQNDAKAIAVNSDVVNEKDTLVEYPDAFGEGVHLQYSAIHTGLKENIVLDAYKGENTFRFRLETGDFMPATMEGKSITFMNPETEETAFTIAEIYAQDSYDGPYDEIEHITYDNYYMLERLEEGIYQLCVSVDASFLESPNTVYPVTIDPTYIAASQYISGFSDATVATPQLSNNDSSGQTMTAEAGSKLIYVKNPGLVTSCKHINPNLITSVNYSINAPAQTAPSSKITVQIPWSSHNINTVSYSTLLSNFHHSYGSRTLPACTTGTSATYAFDLTGVFKNWLQYALGEGGYSYEIGFVLQAETGKRTFASFENAAVSTRPQMMVYYNDEAPLEESPVGVYYIRNKQTSKVLSVPNTATSGTEVTTSLRGSQSAQLWSVEKLSNNRYRIKSSLNDGWYLGVTSTSDSNGLALCLTTTAYNWRIVNNNDGTFRLFPMTSSTKSMGVDFAGGKDQSRVILWNYEHTEHEKWIFEVDYTVSGSGQINVWQGDGVNTALIPVYYYNTLHMSISNNVKTITKVVSRFTVYNTPSLLNEAAKAHHQFITIDGRQDGISGKVTSSSSPYVSTQTETYEATCNYQINTNATIVIQGEASSPTVPWVPSIFKISIVVE